MSLPWWSVIESVVADLEKKDIHYCFLDASALFLQGIALDDFQQLELSIQWDQFSTAAEWFAADGASAIEKSNRQASFQFTREGVPVTIRCYYNTVVAADPDRVEVVHDGKTYYAKYWAFYTRLWGADDPRTKAIRASLRRLQREISAQNGAAWNQDPYKAWLRRFGLPEIAAQNIRKDPANRLRTLLPYLGELNGKKAINLLGSHGSKAVAMGLLGAQVTVADISSGNERYARELAAAADVDLHYVVGDVLELPPEERTGDYDLVLMEGGILHYFVDLQPLTELVAQLLKPGGRLVLNDFHPISTKLITSKGKKHKVTGNYFEKGLVPTPVAYSVHFDADKQAELQKVLLRKWTLGEIVTAIADAGLFVRELVEEPNTKSDDFGLPKMFTVVASKLQR